ncbi:hypothetical protein NE852_13535 [Rhizobium sp. Pop5]|uniref:hypothetical protein n=1 Tax=Rhizobium sp. Pop5 TaxID=1223565 RepID=UPI000283A1C0|nr:hypothetical protein [Rhizobium sp. Pop5]EJZ17962.1 hypothetical protein RCCGEPOP_28059 [Rhizobium sp. Pop5]UVD55129.1 hypothetical protein NE852_13535 [Rhizobium sp. Pop5]
MNSYRAVAFVAASVLVVLSASAASACSCGRSSAKDKFAEADLIVRGRMKLVTFGVEMPDPRSDGEAPRLTRGDFEIDKVVKGTFKGKALSVYTGAGMGDCGRLSEFLTSAFYYRDKKFGVFEFGLSKHEFAGQTFYSTSICEYAKGPKDGQE